MATIKIFGSQLTSQEVINKQFSSKLLEGIKHDLSTYLIEPPHRSNSNLTEAELSEDGMVYYEFEDGSYMFLTSEEVKALCIKEKESRNFRSSSIGSKELFLSVSFSENGTRDGLIQKGLAKIVSFITGKLMDDIIGELGANAVLSIAHKLESSAVKIPGLYQLTPDKKIGELAKLIQGEHYFLFVHGTNSNTVNAFLDPGKDRNIIDNNNRIFQAIQNRFGTNIVAIEHHTLTVSPLANVLDLIKTLPAEIELTMMSHSRGGLIIDSLLMCLDAVKDANKCNQLRQYLIDEKRSQDLSILNQIINELKGKNIHIQQVIKVASPGAGTTLLSDNVINLLRVLAQSAKLFTSMMGDEIIELTEKLLVAMIKSKDKTDGLTGLEAMTPDNPFLDMINSYQIQSEPKSFLMTGKSRLSFNIPHSIKFLLSRMIIQDDSDMVVNTASMTQGLPLKQALTTLATNGQVYHSSYFYQKNTADEITKAITSKGDFSATAIIRTSVYDGQRGIELEYGNYKHQEVTGRRPITVVIPGMMASTLTNENNDRLWIDYFDIFSRSLLDMGINDSIKVDGILSTAYKAFCEYLLRSGHDVYVIPYDWRLSYDSQLPGLTSHFNTILRKAGNQPIRIVSHSKGGLLLRQLIFSDFKLYKELADRPGFRWIMLGTPWYGSYAAVKTIIGQSKTLKNLKKISFLVSTKQLLQIFSKYPGILELLPLNISNHSITVNQTLHDYTSNQVWKDIFNKDTSNNHKWLIPDVELLKIKELKAMIESVVFGTSNDELPSSINLNKENIYYIAGLHELTPYNLSIDSKRASISVHDIKYQGDSTVTWAEGIPIGFDSNHVFYTDTKHDRLLDDDSIFRSIIQLIDTGSCNLPKQAPSRSTRSAIKDQVEPIYSSRFESSNVKGDNIRAIFGEDISNGFVSSDSLEKINVTLAHGDLMFSKGPLMIGHFESEGITKAEARLDFLLDNYLINRFDSGNYPNAVGDSLYHYISKQNKPKGALVVGLGETMKLSGYKLAESVRKAVVSSVMQHTDFGTQLEKPLESISTLLIGTAYGDLTIATSINAIIEGVYQANAFLLEINQRERGFYPMIKELEFIEIYQDKAIGAFKELKRLQEANRINFDPSKITTKSGSRSMVSSDYGIDKWNHLRIRLNGGCPVFNEAGHNCTLVCNPCQQDGVVQNETNIQSKKIYSCSNNQKYLEFDLGTGIARDENRKNFISLDDAKDFMDQIKKETDPSKFWDLEISKSLFEMLIPNDFKQDLRAQHNLVLNLDTAAASFPWELIQDTAVSQRPICVNAGMIRRLNTKNFRIRTTYSKQKNVLIIGDPILNHPKVSQLNGAVMEANLVKDILSDRMNVIDKIGTTSGDIIKAIYAHESRIIHIAAHGDFDPQDARKSGIIIGYNKEKGTFTYLNASNIAQMDVVPDFVFINTCYSGKNNEDANKLAYNTYGFAANVGEEFMAAGVKAIIVAGWPVYDDLAQIFAVEFYKHFLEEKSFGECVQLARLACYEADPNRNTWGAYQCYGDPTYTFRSFNNAIKKQYALDLEVFNDLQNLSNRLDYYKGHEQDIIDDLNELNDAIINLNINDGPIIEKQAEVYAKTADLNRAVELYGKLLKLDKALYSVKAIEQLMNVKAKMVVAEFLNQKQTKADTLDELNKICTQLESINKIGESSERYSLLGSTFKRMAFILAKEGENYIPSLTQSLKHYEKAFILKNNDKDYYALLNLILCKYFVNADLKKLKSDHNKVERKIEVSGEYYSDILNFNKDLTEYLISGKIDRNSKSDKILEKLTNEFDSVWKYSGSNNKLKGEIEQVEMIVTFLLSKIKGIKKDSEEQKMEKQKLKLISDLLQHLKKL